SRKRSIHQIPFERRVLPFPAIHSKMTLLFRVFQPFVPPKQSARDFHNPINLPVYGEDLQSAIHFADCPTRHYETLLPQRQSPFFYEDLGCRHRSKKEHSLGNPK